MPRSRKPDASSSAAAPAPAGCLAPVIPIGLAGRGGRRRALRLGVGGPVGSGKTTLVSALCRALGGELSLAVVSNDVHAREDAARDRKSVV